MPFIKNLASSGESSEPGLAVHAATARRTPLLTRAADRSQNPHRRSRVSPHLPLRKTHLVFSLDPRHPQTMEGLVLRSMDV